MELSVRLVTRPRPETGTRVLILIIVIIAVLAFQRTGYAPGTAIPLALSAGLAAAQVARALLDDKTPASLPAGDSGQAHPGIHR
jgi:hypothetical protein